VALFEEKYSSVVRKNVLYSERIKQYIQYMIGFIDIPVCSCWRWRLHPLL